MERIAILCKVCTCLRAYVTFVTSVTNAQVYVQIFILTLTDISVRVSLVGHKLGIFYARKLKFGMLLTHK